ncbi:MAG TPA: glycosyltransferase family 2 protein [Acidimicrobiales bacterium]|nr:glycosyltransferase family 2 protein [Acidimicrobiales bacterium]
MTVVEEHSATQVMGRSDVEVYDLTASPAGVAAPAPATATVGSGVVRRRPRPAPVSLSVIMPVFNEEATVRQAVADVLSTEFPCPARLIVVDDGSTDGTAEILRTLSDPRLTVLHHRANRGKGAALRTGAASADTTHVVPFDADLEYAASDLVHLLGPVMAGGATIVYGSRRCGRAVPHSSRLYAVGNAVMTRFAQRLFRADLTDLHTCLKLVPLDVFRRIPLLEEGFGLDTELTAWLLRSGMTFSEVPITYRSRSRSEGKKIGWRDSLACFHILLLIRLEHPRALTVDSPVLTVDAPGQPVAIPDASIDTPVLTLDPAGHTTTTPALASAGRA